MNCQQTASSMYPYSYCFVTLKYLRVQEELLNGEDNRNILEIETESYEDDDEALSLNSYGKLVFSKFIQIGLRTDIKLSL